MKIVGIKYCGECNPEINIEEFIKRLKSRLNSLGFTLTTDIDKSYGLIIVNGCRVGCLKREKFANFENVVVINGASIDSFIVDESKLAEKTAEKLFGGSS